MANANSINKHLPIFYVEINHGQIESMELPQGLILNEDVYALDFGGEDWTGELSNGDLVFADPRQAPIANDYVVIWPKGSPTPAIEQMALAYMPGSIGEVPHPDSNIVPVLSIKRPGGIVKTVQCSKLEKVHKVIGKAKVRGAYHA